MIDQRTRTQLVRFLLTGILATIADASVYFSLLATVLADRYDWSKAFAFLVGTTVSYLLNKHWTFEAREPNPRQTAAFVALYTVAFGVNVGANRLGLLVLFALGVPEVAAEPVAFVFATGCSTVLNFVGQKLWVFRDAAAG